MTIRVLLACNQGMIGESLRYLLEAQPQFEVVGVASERKAIRQQARELSPDVVLLDVEASDRDAIELIEQLTSGPRGARVVALTTLCDRHSVMRILKAGTAAYVLKNSGFDELCAAIQATKEEKCYLSPQIAHFVVEVFVLHLPAHNICRLKVLTNREEEVLQMLAVGCSTREIADRLNLSPKTIACHRQRIKGKLDIHKTIGFYQYAIQHGILDLTM